MIILTRFGIILQALVRLEKMTGESDNGRRVYLASASPRRKELLALTGIDFTVMPLGEIDENILTAGYHGDAIGLAEHLSREKAKLALNLGIDGIFITADTLVISGDGAVLGKPNSRDEAEMYLDRLAGNWHTVVTGVALVSKPDLSPDMILSLHENTRVKFAPMTHKEIIDYIDTGEPFDKAGGYGIQGRASIYIERIDGCYFNVVGFPVHAFWKMWQRFKRF